MQSALRLVSLFLIVAGLVLLGADAIASFDKAGELTVRSVDQLWAALDTGSLAAFKTWLEHSAAWAAHGVETAMTLPGWAVTGVPGVLLAFIAARLSGGGS